MQYCCRLKVRLRSRQNSRRSTSYKHSKSVQIREDQIILAVCSSSVRIWADFVGLFPIWPSFRCCRSAPGASGRSSVDLEPTPPGRKRLGPAPLVPNPLRSGHSPPPLRFQPLHFCPNLQKIRQNLPRSGLRLTKQPRSLYSPNEIDELIELFSEKITTFWPSNLAD